MFVVMNRLTVPAEAKEPMIGRFQQAGERMKNVPGLVDFMFLTDNQSEEVVTFTKWESEEAFKAWTNSDHFKAAHSGVNMNGPVKGSMNTYTVAASI